MGEITPSGYISLHDALRHLAKIEDYKEGDDEWFDIGDRLNDAQALHDATEKIRQHLCDSELTGYYFPGGGKPHPVPEGTWTEDEACLERAGPDQGFERLWYFHRRGIQVNDVRWPVFLIESEFEKLRKGETRPKTSMAPKINHGRGRPKGSSPIDDDDEEFLLLMDPMIEQGDTIMTAADIVVAENRGRVWRDTSKTKDASVSSRFQRKWNKTRRPSSD